jgi:hypothetical protein
VYLLVYLPVSFRDADSQPAPDTAEPAPDTAEPAAFTTEPAAFTTEPASDAHSDPNPQRRHYRSFSLW